MTVASSSLSAGLKMTEREAAVFRSVLEFFQRHPWIQNHAGAGEASLRINYMCEAGWYYLDDESLPLEQRLDYTGEDTDRLISLADQGDRIAHEALCAIAKHLDDRGKTLPPGLQRYVVSAALTPAKYRQGKHPVTNVIRDEAIFHAVELAIKAGLLPTRNKAARGKKSAAKSPCSIVPRRLGMSISALMNRVWQSFGPNVDRHDEPAASKPRPTTF